MLSGVSLSGSLAVILAAAAMVVSAHAGLWAINKVIGLFKNDDPYAGERADFQNSDLYRNNKKDMDSFFR